MKPSRGVKRARSRDHKPLRVLSYLKYLFSDGICTRGRHALWGLRWSSTIEAGYSTIDTFLPQGSLARLLEESRAVTARFRQLLSVGSATSSSKKLKSL